VHSTASAVGTGGSTAARCAVRCPGAIWSVRAPDGSRTTRTMSCSSVSFAWRRTRLGLPPWPAGCGAAEAASGLTAGWRQRSGRWHDPSGSDQAGAGELAL